MRGLLFITHKTERFGYLDGARAVLDGGCRSVQLRMKDAAPEEVAGAARELKELCDVYGADLYVDDHVCVAMEVSACGVHLGKHDMSPDQARRMIGLGPVIGGTANTFADIVRLRDQGVDYIGLGPFRFTQTKKNLSPVLGLGGYEQIIGQCRKAGINLPIVAIGGITAEDIPLIMRSGVSAIALSSAILTAANPTAETKRIIEIINNA